MQTTTIFLVVLALLLLRIIYKKIYKPYSLLKYYQRQFTSLGYKPYMFRFIPFISDAFLEFLNDEKKHHDSYYSVKKLSPQYDMTVCNYGQKILIFLNNTALMQQFYAKDVSGEYRKEKQTIRGLARFIQNAITFSEGDLWKKKRKNATMFLNYEYLHQQIPIISQIVDRKIAMFSSNRSEFQVNMLELCQSISSTTIIQLFFGGGQKTIENLVIEDKKIGTYIRQIIQLIGQQVFDPLALLFGMGFFQLGVKKRDRDLTHRLKLFRAAVREFIKERLQEIKDGKSSREDYISKIYSITDEEQRKKDEFVEELLSDFSALFGAGTDTTSHSAMMMIYLCILHPDVRNKLQEEIEKYVKDDKEISENTLKEMKYLDLVFHEVMRIYQPANGIFFREAQYDHLVKDLKILKGTLISVGSLANNYNTQFYENPFEFRPERWLKEDGSVMVPKPFAWIPFSAGPRSCVGKVLAQIEMKLMTIMFFKRYRLQMSETQLKMRLHDFSYQPQPLKTKFIAK